MFDPGGRGSGGARVEWQNLLDEWVMLSTIHPWSSINLNSDVHANKISADIWSGLV